MKEFIIGRNDAGQRLDRFVSKTAAPLIPESLLQKTLRKKDIKINGRPAKGDTPRRGRHGARLSPGRVFLKRRGRKMPGARSRPPARYRLRGRKHPARGQKAGRPLSQRGGVELEYAHRQYPGVSPRKGRVGPGAGEQLFAPALCNRIDRNTGGIVIAAKNAGRCASWMKRSKPRDREDLSRRRRRHAAPRRRTARGVSLQGREE